MTTIYTGTMKHVTVDLLDTWLWGRWLPDAFTLELTSETLLVMDGFPGRVARCRRKVEEIEEKLEEKLEEKQENEQEETEWIGEVLAYRKLYRLEWSFRDIVTLADPKPYIPGEEQLLHSEWMEAALGRDHGLFRAEQWYTNKVEVSLVEYRAGEFTESLRSWIEKHYGCTLAGIPLTNKQQEQWDKLENLKYLADSRNNMTIGEAEIAIGIARDSGRVMWGRLRNQIGIDPPKPMKAKWT